MVSHAVETAEEVRTRLERYKREAVEAKREVLLAATRDGSDLRGVLFSVPGSDPAPDLRGVCSLTDMALPRPVEQSNLDEAAKSIG